MDVSSLYTNIPQEEGIESVCTIYDSYETFQNNDPLIPKHYVREMLGVILTENSFEFNKKKISSNPWCRNGHKNNSVFCKHIHGGDRDKFNSTKMQNGNVTLTFPSFGIVKELKWNVNASLNMLTHSTFLYRELKRYSFSNRNLSEFSNAVSTYVVYVS